MILAVEATLLKEILFIVLVFIVAVPPACSIALKVLFEEEVITVIVFVLQVSGPDVLLIPWKGAEADVCVIFLIVLLVIVIPAVLEL